MPEPIKREHAPAQQPPREEHGHKEPPRHHEEHSPKEPPKHHDGKNQPPPSKNGKNPPPHKP